MTTEKTKAIYVESAYCTGSGSDRWKRVSGMTSYIMEEIEEVKKQLGANEITILVPSHTEYQGQRYKRAIHTAYGWDHRQCRDDDYSIVYRIHGPGPLTHL